MRKRIKMLDIHLLCNLLKAHTYNTREAQRGNNREYKSSKINTVLGLELNRRPTDKGSGSKFNGV